MDDIEALHNSITELEVQVANAEKERNYYAVQAKELMSVVKNQDQDEVKQNLIDQSQHIAELSMENYKLKERINSASAEKERLQKERDMENKILQEVVRSVQKESSIHSDRTENSGYTATLSSDDDETTVSDDLSLESIKATESAAMKIKIYIENLEKDRQDLVKQCIDKVKRISQLEITNQELKAKIQMFEGLHVSEKVGPVEKEPKAFYSLPAPPMSDDVVKQEEKSIDATSSDGENEDEYYGDLYYGHHDGEVKLKEEPRVVYSRPRSGSMPPSGSAEHQETGEQTVRRKSETALKTLRNQRREDPDDKSVSSIEIDEESIETVKASTNLRKRQSARIMRRSSDASVASVSSVNRSTRSLMNTSSKSLAIHSVLREYDSPGTVKKRFANSMASPWRSPRLLRLRSKRSSSSPPPAKGGNRKAPPSPSPKNTSRRASASSSRQNIRSGRSSLSPSTKNKQKVGLNRTESTPDLMSSPRRAAVQLKLQQQRNATVETFSSRKNPKKQQDKGHIIKVDGVKGTYKGPLREDVPHGVGTVFFINGDTYIGNVVNGKLHGCGTFHFANKKKGIDRGIWRNNKRIWQ